MNKESVTLAARDFHARFPVSVKLRPAAEVGRFVGLYSTPKNAASRQNVSFQRQIRTNFGSSFNDKQEYLQTDMKNLYTLRNLVPSPFLSLENARGPSYFLREKPQGLGCIPREAKMGGASLVTKTFLLETAN